MSEYTDGNVLYATTQDNLAEGIAKNGVLTGLAVSENSTPNMSVLVAVGSAFANSTYRTFASQTNVPLDASDGTHNRLDLIILNSAGSLTKVTGTAATPPNPPDLPTGAILLAIVEVDATVTAIYNADIQDWRLLLGSIQTQMLADNAVTDAKLNSATLTAHLADTTDPHGSSMSISVSLDVPKISRSGDIELESTSGDIILNPSGKTRSTDDIQMENSELLFRDASTQRGKIYATTKLNIDGPAQLSIGTNTEALDIDPVVNCTYSLGSSGTTKYWDEVNCGTLNDGNCSIYPVPTNALETIAALRELLPQNAPRGKYDSKNFPLPLRGWNKTEGRPKEKGRSLSRTVDYLIWAMAEMDDRVMEMEAQIKSVKEGS